MAEERIAPYILAGGRSFRMGRDKAMIVFGGQTLLGRAVETLRSLKSLGSGSAKPQVTVIGQRTLLEGADRAISDSYPGCGPLGGIEAALDDLNRTRAAEWALFLPVDMPFLPASLLDALICEWIEAGRQGASACHVMVGERPQPLVSIVRTELHQHLRDALEAGQFRVTPVLQSACNALASLNSRAIVSSDQSLWRTSFKVEEVGQFERVLELTEAEQRARHLWFANLNTQDDLCDAETFLSCQGSIKE